jgi:hypothetical protein
MERKRRREIALAAVAVLAIAAATYRVRTMAPAATVTQQSARPTLSTGSTAGTAAASTPAQQKGLTEVDLSALSATKAALQEIVRNPFRFRPKPPPPPPPAPVRPPVAQQTGPVEPPPPPRIPLKFIGVFDVPGKGIVANLSDGRGVYRGVVGDTIEGRYRILQIGVESIELAYLDGRGRQTIRLTGQ